MLRGGKKEFIGFMQGSKRDLNAFTCFTGIRGLCKWEFPEIRCTLLWGP